MKKKISLIFLSALVLISCTNEPAKKVKTIPPNGDYRTGTTTTSTNTERGNREKITLENTVFKKLGLPLPYNTFGAPIPYLVPVNDNHKESFGVFEEYNEDKALKYFKNLNSRGHGDNSPYWRWKTSIKKSELYNKAESRLIAIYKNNPRNVLTLVNGEWQQAPIRSVGTVQDIIVAARGESGIITHMLVITSNGKYLIAKEFNVRKLLATNNALYGSKGDEGAYNNKPIMPSVTSLPSAYLALEDDGGYINIYGGGFGHGVGMSQFAAGTLTKNGESYKNVLKRYYTDIKLSTVESVLGKDKEIKVGITTNGSLEHGRLTIFSSENKVQIYNEDIDVTVGENERIDVRNSSGTTTITLENGKTLKTKNPLNFNAKGEYLTLSPVKKSHTSSPRYRGVITVIPRGSSLRVINTLDIEKYLLQVVPSEMPKSFGVEALKVQAVAARTYAVSDILKGKYAKDGFHIKDTVESQVYNNQVENEEATRAIEETAGEIMTYDNIPIDAKYFSTSSGFTSHASNVW
ncbi:SpoIID/LytB domain-containing protein [Fusobacterium hwasookii]|uniref:Stage II sporulation protein SpoIID n=1 Tax=Fusobacterium hwasookii ChDC F206 TaxID=1307443 RepID=A0AAC9A1E1_9FUSO|nr:SpoIID/LytB domain-containing protein [Fusobacterium hwasookii]ALQ35824.1 stage II sporulation protein SpoIID [Fusobacterium hwasookii ChDC F206]ALQ37538.1 stage II sporulation protein SpoIID [Fusobacterium hwasookii ChDC F300]QNE67511.1 SpoIID/LytB domain-containing protein [Fusobacterium hwasookii]QYR54908.1 SpoIID/LytB domain-containing protein [Fusobacterium hwasookii]